MKISFSPPYIDASVIDEVTDSLQSGWITTGPKVKALELSIQQLSGTSEVLCVNSWTSGAIMILKWWGVKAGDEVIVPAYTYCATALAVMHAGATPIMVDVNDDFNISTEAIRNAITPRTKAIFPVDIAGWPCDYDVIMALVNEPEVKSVFKPESETQSMLGRILVVNDAAHSIGARYKGKSIGSETDVNIFSLHAVKNITTAEGGAVCLNLPAPFDNEALYKELRMITLNAQTKDAFTKSQAGSWRYDVVAFGMKINMPDVNAAIGLAQMRLFDQLLHDRKRVANRYTEAFSQYDWALLPPHLSSDRESSYHLYALRFKYLSEEQRNRIIEEVTKKEIAVNVHFIPLPMLTFFKKQGYDIQHYPQAYLNYSREISLPIYPQLTNEEVDYIVDAVCNAYQTVVKTS